MVFRAQRDHLDHQDHRVSKERMDSKEKEDFPVFKENRVILVREVYLEISALLQDLQVHLGPLETRVKM